MSINALVLAPEGTVSEITIEKQDGSYLKPLQDLVGGYIEFAATLDPEVEMVANEDGHPLGLPFNSLATDTGAYGQPIVGTAVLIPAGSFE
jgi:hypothetical protein